MMYHGILNVYKEKGYTSFDVIAKLRGICKQKKIGHTGTLDPDAEGVLPVCFGQATKVSNMIMDTRKQYKATLLLGLETDTQDTSGNVLVCSEWGYLKDSDVRDAIMSFVGDIRQIPPMYSALKINGKKLVDLARQGIEVKREPRVISIYKIEILSVDLPFIEMLVTCSKGTYIRTLCHDIGRKLGCGGVLKELLRTQTSGFSFEDALTLERIEELEKQKLLSDYFVSIESIFDSYPFFTVKKELDRTIKNGGKISFDEIALIPVENQLYRAYTSEGQFIGLYECRTGEAFLRPYKMFMIQ